MSIEDPSYNKIHRRVTTVEEAVKLLTELALRADERIDVLEAAQSNSDVKIGALADSHIRLEAAHIRLEAAQEYTEARMAALADSQIRTDRRLDSLIDIVREGNSDSQ